MSDNLKYFLFRNCAHITNIVFMSVMFHIFIGTWDKNFLYGCISSVIYFEWFFSEQLKLKK